MSAAIVCANLDVSGTLKEMQRFRFLQRVSQQWYIWKVYTKWLLEHLRVHQTNTKLDEHGSARQRMVLEGESGFRCSEPREQSPLCSSARVGRNSSSTYNRHRKSGQTMLHAEACCVRAESVVSGGLHPCFSSTNHRQLLRTSGADVEYSVEPPGIF
jgi:hypothetical protein